VSDPRIGLARNFSCSNYENLCEEVFTPYGYQSIPVLGGLTPYYAISVEFCPQSGPYSCYVTQPSGGSYSFSTTWRNVNTSITQDGGHNNTSVSLRGLQVGNFSFTGNVVAGGCSGTVSGGGSVVAPTKMTVANDEGDFVDNACPVPSQRGLERQIFYQLSNADGNVGAVQMRESFGNAVTNTCGNPPPTPSSCFTVGSGGQFLDTLATRACGPKVNTCGFYITPDHWQYCSTTPTTVGSPTYSVEWIDININSSRHLASGTLIP
jgi:hypothetical protein